MAQLKETSRSGVGGWWWVTALPLISLLACQPRGEPDTTREQGALTGNITISGRISNSSGVGIAGVRVALNGTSQAVQSTGSSGSFSFAQLARGS